MDETLVLIGKAHQGDKVARDLLVEQNTGLVWSIVRRFLNRGAEAEDLFQIGSIGLMKAIDKFDMGYEVRFSTYAVPMITGEIKRFLRDDGMLKVSRSLKETAAKGYAAGKSWNGDGAGSLRFRKLRRRFTLRRRNWRWLWKQGRKLNLCRKLFIREKAMIFH